MLARRAAGWTLIEVMVALLTGGIIITLSAALLAQIERAYCRFQARGDMLSQELMITSEISQELRSARFSSVTITQTPVAIAFQPDVGDMTGVFVIYSCPGTGYLYRTTVPTNGLQRLSAAAVTSDSLLASNAHQMANNVASLTIGVSALNGAVQYVAVPDNLTSQADTIDFSLQLQRSLSSTDKVVRTQSFSVSPRN